MSTRNRRPQRFTINGFGRIRRRRRFNPNDRRRLEHAVLWLSLIVALAQLLAELVGLLAS